METIKDCTVIVIDLWESTTLSRILPPAWYSALNSSLFDNLLNALKFDNLLNTPEAIEFAFSRGDDITLLVHGKPRKQTGKKWEEKFLRCEAIVRELDQQLRSMVKKHPKVKERVDQTFGADLPLLRIAMGMDVGDVHRAIAKTGEAPETLVLGKPVTGAEEELKKAKAGNKSYGLFNFSYKTSVSDRFFSRQRKLFNNTNRIPSGRNTSLERGSIRDRLKCNNARKVGATVIMAALPSVPEFLLAEDHEVEIQQQIDLSCAAYRTVLQGFHRVAGNVPIATDGEMYVIPSDFSVPEFFAEVMQSWTQQCDGLAALTLTETQRSRARQRAYQFPYLPLTDLRLTATKDTVIQTSYGYLGLPLIRAARWLGANQQLVASLEALRPLRNNGQPTKNVQDIDSLAYRRPQARKLKGVKAGGADSHAQAIAAVFSAAVRQGAADNLVNAPRSRTEPPNVSMSLPPVEPIVIRQ